jgi:O-antigen ligase
MDGAASAAPRPVPAPAAAPPGGMAALRRWCRARLADIFSFETALICLIYFPDIKSAASAGTGSTGLLVAFSALCFAGAVALLVRGRIRLRKDAAVLLWLWLAFVAWALLSLLWTPSVVAAQRAVMMLLTMSTCTLAGAAFVVSPEPRRMQRYYAGVLFMGLWLGWISFETYRHITATGAARNIMALGLNYLILGRAIGAATLVCGYYTLYSRWRWQWRLLSGALALALCGVMLVLGGRSPLLATGLGGIILLWGSVRVARSSRGLLLQALGVALVLALLAPLAAKVAGAGSALTSLRRIEFLLNNGFQTNERYIRYTRTWIELGQQPWVGRGLASWPITMGYGDRHEYAHDIFLEVWYELGLPGLALLLAMWWWALQRYWPPRRWAEAPLAPLALALFANATVGAVTSGDYTEQWWLYANMALLLVLPLAGAGRRRRAAALPAASTAPAG